MLIKKKKAKEENNIFENISAIEDRILPDVLEEKADYLYLGYNKYSRTFVITIYPEQTWLRLVRGTCVFRRCNNITKDRNIFKRKCYKPTDQKVSTVASRICQLYEARKYRTYTCTGKRNCRFRRFKNFNTNKSR